MHVRSFALSLCFLALAACGEGRDRGRGTYTPGTRCGNDLVEGTETCDGTQLGGATCESLGLTAGALSCASDCRSLDRSACGAAATCGNAAIDGPEVCDGVMLNEDCTDRGFGGGTLSCLPNCNGYDTRACTAPQPMCGDNRVEGVEVCDGTQLGGVTCQSLGFASGTLSCAADCMSRVTSGCTGGSCTPDCTGRVCGNDPVCGMSCGTCTTGQCNASGLCETTTGQAPRILSFTSNVTRLIEGQSVSFSAIVTDSDGVGDVIGGQLRSPSGATYGTFATAAEEGAYSLSVSWSQIHQLEPINASPGGTSRVFRAEFFDVAGHTVTQDITIQLGCSDTSASICDGNCQSTDDDPNNCGACGNVCGPGILPWNKGQGVCSEGTCWASYVFDGAMVPTTCGTLCSSAGMSCSTRALSPLQNKFCEPMNPSDVGCGNYYDYVNFNTHYVSFGTCNTTIQDSVTLGADTADFQQGECYCRQ